MSESERRRFAEAIMDLVIADGYARVTLRAVCERAGLDRDAFDRHFVDLEDCYLRTFEANSERFDRAVRTAFDAHDEWRAALRAAGYAAADFIDANPREVRFGVVSMFQAGPMAQVYRERQLQGMIDLIDRGRAELADPDSLGRGVAEAALGAVYQRLVKQMRRGEARSAADFVPELMFIAVRHYLGHEAALEELRMPPPRRRGPPSATVPGEEGRRKHSGTEESIDPRPRRPSR